MFRSYVRLAVAWIRNRVFDFTFTSTDALLNFWYGITFVAAYAAIQIYGPIPFWVVALFGYILLKIAIRTRVQYLHKHISNSEYSRGYTQGRKDSVQTNTERPEKD